jgi:hypothetical protein
VSKDTLETLLSVIDVLVKAVALIAGIWALLKVKAYRELKNRIQLDIEANVYRLDSPERVRKYTWTRKAKQVTRELSDVQPHTHAVEILLHFTNQGMTRFKMYNVQVGINTMRPIDEAEFDEDDGHLHLTRILTSGNIVPRFPVEGRPIEETSFYYIEPGVKQTITYLALITEPRELIQVFAQFSLEQKRIFPEKIVGEMKVYPHTAARTYQLDAEGRAAPT